MIKLCDYIKAIEGTVLTTLCRPEDIEINDAYVSDMLSDVMGSAKSGMVWITIMKHLNTIAVASMTGVRVILFAKDSTPDSAVIDKANEEEICLVRSSKSVFELSGLLYQMLQK